MDYACPNCGIEVSTTDVCCWSCGVRLVKHDLDLGDDDATCDFDELEEYPDPEPDDSMDGDFDSAMASAGYGTDEDYGDYGQWDE